MTRRLAVVLLLAAAAAAAAGAAAAEAAAEGAGGLLDWLEDAGGSVRGVRVGGGAAGADGLARAMLERPHQTHDRAGVFAARAARAGEPVAEVPYGTALSIESLLKGGDAEAPLLRLVRALVDRGVTQDTRAFLALHLLSEALDHPGASRERDEFVRRLPPTPRSVCFFTEAEAAELQVPPDSPVLGARDEASRLFRDTFRAVAEVAREDEFKGAFPEGGLTEAWWNWAYATVMNRGFRLDASVPVTRCAAGGGGCEVTEEAARSLALLPLAGDCNYANPAHATVRLEVAPAAAAGEGAEEGGGGAGRGIGAGSSVRLVATRDLAEGDELLLAYGGVPMTNTELMVQYGVALPLNEVEGVQLDLGLEDPALVREDRLLQHRLHIISANDLATSTVVRLNATVDPAFLQALRAKELSEGDIRGLAQIEYRFPPDLGFFSLQNELKVRVQLLGSVETLLAGYKTNLRDDTALLARADGAPSGNAAQAVAFRLAVKRVLHSVMLASFDRLRAVFDGLEARWSEDVARFEAGAGAGAPHAPSPEEAAREIAEWREKTAAWRARLDAWGADWAGWVAEAVRAGWLVPSEAL